MLYGCFEFVFDGGAALLRGPLLLLIHEELALHGGHEDLAAVPRQRHAGQPHAQTVQREPLGPVFRREELHAAVVRSGAEEGGVLFVEVDIGYELDVCGDGREAGAHPQIPDPHRVVLRAGGEVVAVGVEV